MKIGMIGAVALIIGLLIPILGFGYIGFMQDLAIRLIVVGMILLGIDMQIKLYKDFK